MIKPSPDNDNELLTSETCDVYRI